jgi:transcriptional regulator with XRE-family HTH domain
MGDFGQRLREARQRRGLSQLQAGGEQYSGSYISHLESGRRRPTKEVVDFLAGQLDVEPVDLLGTDAEEYRAASAGRELALCEFNARAAWEECDYAEAAAHATRAVEAADRAGRPDAWWNASYLRAQALRAMELYTECWNLAIELSKHPVARGATELRVRALVLASTSRRADGYLESALDHAYQAMDDAASLPATAPSWVHAHLVMISALAELGHLDDTSLIAKDLRAVHDELGDTHLSGLVAWALGNLAFMHGDVGSGRAYHEQAAATLRPNADLRAWGRLHKASATMRLGAGVGQDVAELLESARFALGLVGNRSDKAELTLVEAAYSIHKGEAQQALVQIDESLASDAHLPAHTLGEANTMRHRALTALGKVDDAKSAIAQAALQFEKAGADRRALEAWHVHAGLSSDA